MKPAGASRVYGSRGVCALEHPVPLCTETIESSPQFKKDEITGAAHSLPKLPKP